MTGATTMAGVRAAAGPAVTLVGVIGSPIAQSLSPVLHNAAFAALGLGSDWHSAAFEIAPGQAAAALEDMRGSGIRGLSVTMPHKTAVAELMDDCSEVARRLGAVNCVHNADGALHGANTDGEGFLASLDRGAGFTVEGRRCLVSGAGGAARAVILALAGAGAADVAVVNRTAGRGAAAAALAGSVGRLIQLGDEAEEVAAQADLVVNATSVGMGAHEDEHWAVPPSLLHAGQVVADLVYVPRPTRWLAAAAAAGATTVDGLGMLVHQAAAQIALWTGRPAPVDAMWRAVSPPG